MRATCFFACVTLASGLAVLQPAAQQRPPDTFRSGRDVLTVNASVRDGSGRPLTDLQPADFVVRIDGQPRTVLTARLFGTEAGRATTAGHPTPRATRGIDTPRGRVVV